MKIVIVVEGGIVQNVFSDAHRPVEVVIVDHDTEGCTVDEHPALRDIFGEIIGFNYFGEPDYLPAAVDNIYKATG